MDTTKTTAHLNHFKAPRSCTFKYKNQLIPCKGLVISQVELPGTRHRSIFFLVQDLSGERDWLPADKVSIVS